MTSRQPFSLFASSEATRHWFSHRTVTARLRILTRGQFRDIQVTVPLQRVVERGTAVPFVVPDPAVEREIEPFGTSGRWDRCAVAPGSSSDQPGFQKNRSRWNTGSPVRSPSDRADVDLPAPPGPTIATRSHSILPDALAPDRRTDDARSCQVLWTRGSTASFRSWRRRRRNDRSDSLVLHSIARSNAADASSRRSSRAKTSARAVWKYT